MTTFVKFMRSEASDFLESEPIANHVLSVIARRARRTPHPYNGLETNECHMGDYEKLGISRQQYRSAMDKLEKWGLVTTKATNKGTVATLANTDVYDINTKEQPAEQPASNQPPNQPVTNQVTTNKELKKLRTQEKYIPPVPDGVEADLWKEYLKTRTKLKAPNTERAITTLINALNKLVAKGYKANDLIETANSSGWKSVYEPKDFGQRKSKPSTPDISELNL